MERATKRIKLRVTPGGAPAELLPSGTQLLMYRAHRENMCCIG